MFIRVVVTVTSRRSGAESAMNECLFIYLLFCIYSYLYLISELQHDFGAASPFRENLSLLPISKYITNTNTLLPFLPQPRMSFFATGYPRKSLDVRVEKANV